MPTAEPHHPLIESWLEQLQKQGRSPHTRQAYRRGWGHLAQWYGQTYGEPCDPTRLIARDIRDWKSYQQSVAKAAPSTINQRLVAVSSFYKWALAQNLVTRDPTAGIPPFAWPRGSRRACPPRRCAAYCAPSTTAARPATWPSSNCWPAPGCGWGSCCSCSGKILSWVTAPAGSSSAKANMAATGKCL
jgi:hypothetical protein